MSKDKLNHMKKRHDPYISVTIKEWTDSAPILRLSAYLKKHKDMELVIIDGNPALHFAPPIKRNQKERIHHASIAYELLQEARADLVYCIKNGLITLNERRIPR
jgi:hypothetical protein